MKLKLLTGQMQAQLVVAPDPSQLLATLETLRKEISECPKEAQQQLKNLALNTEMDIKKYQLMHTKANEKLEFLKKKKPDVDAGQKHYEQLEKALDAQKKHVEDKSAVNQDIKATEYARFRTLQRNGLPMARNAKEFQELKAKDRLLLATKDPALKPKKPNFIKKALLTMGKFSAGFGTALGIDHMINPEHYEAITGISLTIGLGFAVLMLALTQGSAYRGKEAELKGKNPIKHYVILGSVSIIYMVTEAFINYEGVIKMASEFAAESASSGLLQGAGEQIATSEPVHYSLLIFTVALVAFVALYSALAGRDQAIADMANHNLEVELAKVRADEELMKKAESVDEAQFLEQRMRPKAKRKPEQAPIVRWYQQAVGLLSKAERQLEEEALRINEELAAAGAGIQQKINELGNQIDQAQRGPDQSPPEPVQLIKLAE